MEDDGDVGGSRCALREAGPEKVSCISTVDGGDVSGSQAPLREAGTETGPCISTVDGCGISWRRARGSVAIKGVEEYTCADCIAGFGRFVGRDGRSSLRGIDHSWARSSSSYSLTASAVFSIPRKLLQ